MNACKQVSFTSNGTKVSGSVGKMSFPNIGDGSHAYNMSLSASKSGLSVTVGLDMVLFKKGPVDGEIIYFDLGTPDVTQLQTFVSASVDRIEGKTPPASSAQ